MFWCVLWFFIGEAVGFVLASWCVAISKKTGRDKENEIKGIHDAGGEAEPPN